MKIRFIILTLLICSQEIYAQKNFVINVKNVGAEIQPDVFCARTMEDVEKKFLIELVGSIENVIGTHEIIVKGAEWKKYECFLKAGATDAKGKIRLFLNSEGVVDL